MNSQDQSQLTSSSRERLHTRSVEFNGYRRADGRWDIEAELRDFRHYDTQTPMGLLPAQASVHHMAITLTLDDELTVQDVSARMMATPFSTCLEIETSLKPMIGVRIGTGWRRAITERLGGTKSCTHLRELLANMATAALQTIPTWHAQQNKKQGQAPVGRPLYLGQCHAWRLDGPIVKRIYPQFHQPPHQDNP
ncbi:MAG: DUF2889 domain-containing protein [Proteobacteria bacterium]|nr:DUF2889 domain-containing protein [Pseudomonadota bacterium]